METIIEDEQIAFRRVRSTIDNVEKEEIGEELDVTVVAWCL